MAASNHLYLEVTRNLLGVFMPTNNLTLKVSSAAAKIKKEITVTEVPVPIKKDDESESIAVKATREHDHENSTVTVMKEGGHEITYSTVWREDCQEEIARHLYMEELQQPSRDAIKKVLDDLVNVYYPKIFADNATLAPLFEWRKKNHSIKPKILFLHQGTINLQAYVITIMIPLYRTGDLEIGAKWYQGGDIINIRWDMGFVVLVPGKADLYIGGPGHLVMLSLNFVEMAAVMQR